jgi:hypothetical protein
MVPLLRDPVGLLELDAELRATTVRFNQAVAIENRGGVLAARRRWDELLDGRLALRAKES